MAQNIHSKTSVSGAILKVLTATIFKGLLFLGLAMDLPGSAVGMGKSQGIFEVRIKDHREAIGDFSQLNVVVGELLISPQPGIKFWQSGWKSLTPVPEVIDLTKYVSNKSVRVFRGGLDTGAFDAIHLKLKEFSGLLKKGQQSTKIKNTIGPVKLAFEIRPQGETIIILDLVVLDMSDHPPQGYELGLQGYEVYINGKLVDKVPPGP